MCLKLGFVFFWQNDFGTKAVHKMLVKLTPVQNFDLGLFNFNSNLKLQQLNIAVT
jgi:hypothetical protein